MTIKPTKVFSWFVTESFITTRHETATSLTPLKVILDHFQEVDLSRDHVVPISRGGRDKWTNVVTSCKRCNARKGNLKLEESSMDLLALPYRPNHAEYLALSHSGRILGDQMAFLQRQFSANSRFLSDRPEMLAN